MRSSYTVTLIASIAIIPAQAFYGTAHLLGIFTYFHAFSCKTSLRNFSLGKPVSIKFSIS